MKVVHLRLFCLLALLTGSVTGYISKCCPAGSGLQIERDSVIGCESMPKKNVSTFDIYNVETSNRSSIPQCKYTVRGLFKDDQKFIRINGCVDRSVDGNIYALSCGNEPTFDIHELNKCCSSGEFYDHTDRFCASNSDTKINLTRFFNNEAIVFKTHVPDCNPNEVFVEYFSTKHDIRFADHSLSIFGEILDPKSFCVESLVNISPNESDADHIIIRSCRPKSICDRIPCVRRCCKTDQVIPYPNTCAAHPQNANFVPVFHDLELPITGAKEQQETVLREFGVFNTLKCEKKYRLKPDDVHYLHKNGSLFVNEHRYDHHEYCIENIQHDAKTIKIGAFICLEQDSPVKDGKFYSYPRGLIVSCIFLTLTLAVYLILPKLLNINGKILLCYVISLLVAYALLAHQHMKNEQSSWCLQIALTLVYSFTAVFCWQTVMSFDIWLRFGSIRPSICRRFLYYSLYGWGFPFLWTMFTWFASEYKPFAVGWNPSFGSSSGTCFFSSINQRKAHFLYILVPMVTHILINLVLFILTAINYSKAQKEIHRMQSDTNETDATKKQKKFIASKAIFIMNAKLFTVMGISWIFEIISTFVTIPVLNWYNVLLGVFIFVIFVCKRKIYHALKSRIGLKSDVNGSDTPTSTMSFNTIQMNDLGGKNTPLLSIPAANLNDINRT